MAYQFLSGEWFSALANDETKAIDPDDPVINLTVPDAPGGEVTAHIAAVRFGAGHASHADANVVLPFRVAEEIFAAGSIKTAKDVAQKSCILGEIEIDGDYSAWAMITSPYNGMLVDVRNGVADVTDGRPVGLVAPQAIERVRINDELERLGLGAAAAELDEQGYYVLTPDVTGIKPEMMDRARVKIMDLIEAQTGVRPNEVTGETHHDVFYPALWYSIFADQVFQDMAVNEYALALVAHLLGRNFQLSQDEVLMKGPSTRRDGRLQLGLHCDITPYGFEEPFPEEHLSVNVLWAVSDFTDVAEGVTVFVPGTQHLRRVPVGMEGQNRAVPIIVPRGSFIVWPGTTWHGALPRTKPGLRTAMTIQYCKYFMKPRQPYQYDVTDEILRRNPSSFAAICAQNDRSGWREEGIDARMLMRARQGSQLRAADPRASIPAKLVAGTRKKLISA